MRKAFVILTPAFSLSPIDQWLPFQGSFIRTLNRLYPELRVIVMAFHYPIVSDRHTSWEGNDIIAFGGQMRGGIRSVLRWAEVWRALGSIRRKYEIIGVLSMFCSESAFVGHYFAKLHKLRHKIWVLGQDARRDNSQVRRIRPRPEELIAISDFVVREFQQSHGIRPAYKIPIGIVPEDFPEREDGRPVHLIGAGTLSPIKRYEVFIDIVAALRTSIPDLRAVICGGGSEQESLQQRISDLGLQDHLEIATGMSRPQVLDLMQRSRVLLHPSSYEGFGMVCTEALYAGAQVISFVQPMDEPIPGWHIARDPEEMAAIALGLLRQDELDDTPALPFAMNDTVQAMMELYGYDGA